MLTKVGRSFYFRQHKDRALGKFCDTTLQNNSSFKQEGKLGFLKGVRIFAIIYYTNYYKLYYIYNNLKFLKIL